MATPLKLSLPLPTAWLKKLGLGLVVCGPWSFIALALVERGAIGQQAIAQLIAWGPAAMILVAIYALVERWAPKVVAAQAEGARAQQKLADSVQELVARGDRDVRETQLMLKYTAQGVERLHETVNAMRDEMRSHANHH